MRKFTLDDFVLESNRIEGIEVVLVDDMEAHERFLSNPVSVEALVTFVGIVAEAQLRDRAGMDVQVGKHHPMAGGPYVRVSLGSILNGLPLSPYATHKEYEWLHPFMDGNGRSGRALWLHLMGGIENAPLGFLHTWYYQSLDNSR